MIERCLPQFSCLSVHSHFNGIHAYRFDGIWPMALKPGGVASIGCAQKTAAERNNSQNEKRRRMRQVAIFLRSRSCVVSTAAFHFMFDAKVAFGALISTSTPMTMKDQIKPISVRTYDADGYRKRAAAVCIKDDKGEEVLLVTSKRTDVTCWVVPGGGIEPGEKAADAAEREVFEEAGVKGSIVRTLGVFENEQCKHRTSVYLLRVAEEFQDWEDARRIGRKRRWFPVDEARRLLGMHKESQQAYLDTMSKSDNVLASTSTPTIAFPVMATNGKSEDLGNLCIRHNDLSSNSPSVKR